jgi:hypothetical protein
VAAEEGCAAHTSGGSPLQERFLGPVIGLEDTPLFTKVARDEKGLGVLAGVVMPCSLPSP